MSQSKMYKQQDVQCRNTEVKYMYRYVCVLVTINCPLYALLCYVVHKHTCKHIFMSPNK